MRKHGEERVPLAVRVFEVCFWSLMLCAEAQGSLLKKFSGLILLPSHQGRGRLRDCDKFPDEMIEKYIPEQAREPVQEDSRFVVDNA